MRFRMLAAFLVGAVFFAALPIWAPPIVLQWEGVTRSLMALVAATLAGAALNLVAGRQAGLRLVLACALVGAVLSTVVFLVFVYRYWTPEALVVALMLPVWTFVYLVVPAGIGAWLADLVRERSERLHRD